MALMGYVEIDIDGTRCDNEYGYDVTRTDVAGLALADMIECYRFEASGEVGTASGHGRATGHRVHAPSVFEIPIGKSLPYLLQAWCENSVITLTYHNVRSDHDTGDDQEVLTYTIGRGRIVSYHINDHSTLDADQANHPATLTLGIVGHEYSWECVGAMHEESWDVGVGG